MRKLIILLTLLTSLAFTNRTEPNKADTVKVSKGIASWYGKQFHGKKTSSGLLFDMYKLTAATNKFPLGSKLKVTNLRTNKTVVVTVTDRMGHKTRLIDLSYAAAKELGFISSGLANVSIEVISG